MRSKLLQRCGKDVSELSRLKSRLIREIDCNYSLHQRSWEDAHPEGIIGEQIRNTTFCCATKVTTLIIRICFKWKKSSIFSSLFIISLAVNDSKQLMVVHNHEWLHLSLTIQCITTNALFNPEQHSLCNVNMYHNGPCKLLKYMLLMNWPILHHWICKG